MVYRQLFHETGGSANFGKLQTENRNYAGLTQAEPNGEENRQRDGGTNYYKVYKTDEDFADDYVQSFLRHYDGLKDVNDVDTWAHILKANSYYTDPEAIYSAGMKKAPKTSSSSPKYSEDQIKKAEDDARAAYKNYFTLQEQTRKIAINDRLQAGQTILNQKIANGDVSGAFQYAQVQLAGATTPEEQEYLSGKMASERPKLDRIYEKGLKMTAQEKWGIKQYAKSHTYEQTRAYAERVLPNKIMDDELDASLLEIDDNNKKASNIDLTPYEYKLADVMPKDKTLAGSFKYGVKQEMAGRIEEFKVKHHRPPTDAEKDEIFDAAVATNTLRSTSKPYFGDGDDYSSTISGASNQAIGIVHAEPVGNHYIRVTYRDGSTQDIYESEYNALQRRYTPISVITDDGTTTVSPFGQQGNTFQAIGQLGQSLPNALPASFVSNTDRLFLYNNDQLRANEALRIAKTLNIGADTIMFGDDKAFERADYLSRRAERGQALQDIYDEFPELYKVKYGSQAEGIQALNNIESIKNTKGIFDSIQQSIWAMNDQMKLGDVGFALAYESDPQMISELTAEVNRLQNNLQNYRRPDGGSPLQEVLGSTASQIYMMGKQGGTGAIVGGVIGGIGGGVVSGGSAAIPTAMTGAKWLGSADMAYEMYKMSFGNKYLELIGKRDQKGNRVYSNEEAKEYAMSFAAIDAGIEFVATRAIGKAASKIAPKSALANAVSRGTTTAAETFNRGIGVTAAQVAKTSIKAGAPELFEEGLQDVNEKLQHNLWRKSNDQEGSYSAGDMFVGAGEAMWQALPAVVGFGVIGGGISGVRTMKAFKDFQKLSPEEQHMAVMEEQNRNGHVIMQNLKNDAAANNLAKENPELYGKIVQAQGDNIGVSTAYVNVNEMAETEEGQVAIRNMVDAGLTTQEEVSKAITADAPIEIPIGSYAQLSGGLSEETVKALEESSYFTRGGLSMKTLERAKEEVHAMKDLVKDDTEKRAERVKNDIIRSYFDETSDVDKEMLDVVLADPTHIKQTFNNVYKELTEQYREQYTSDFDAMDTDLETARTGGVNPTWLGENKPPRSNSERRRMAYQSSLARTQNALADNPEALNQAGAHYADMEHTLKQIESLESMRDKLFELADNDIALRMQLSKSGYEVYQSLKAIMSDETVDRKQRDTAEANALLMAQHADVMADIMRRAGRGNYTAMDYFNTVRVQMNGGAYNNGYAQPLQMQQKIETAIKNWGQVVENQLSGKQINRTVQIMDSPLVLQMLGFDGAVMIDPSIVHKVITGKHANQISIDDIKLLPKKIANPVAVFKNYNGRSQKAVPDEAIIVLDMYAKTNNSQMAICYMRIQKK